MRGVFDEPRPPINRKCTQDLDLFVRQLTNPTLEVSNRSQSLDILSNSTERDFARSPTSIGSPALSRSPIDLPRSPIDIPRSPIDLSSDMKDKCLISPEPTKDKKAAKKNWRRRILERKSGQGKIGSCDETVDFSFDHDTRDLKQMSFESTSSRSSAGLKSNQVSFNCDSSMDASDLEQQPEVKSSTLSIPEVQSEQKPLCNGKKDKESKRQRLKRIITRPLRRSQSACCENDIPSHALFLDAKGNKTKDTMESRAMDLLLYQRLFGNNDEDDLKSRRFHKTCSADSALSESDEFLNNNIQPKSKSRNLAKNMKKKFQFLRRQNTDTVVDHEHTFTFFSTTTYDQAIQWSKSLEDLLQDKIGLEMFLGFLRSEFSEENLEFWIACEEFRNCNEANIEMMAHRIYNDFVVSKAPKEINLDSDTRMDTTLALEKPDKDTFEVAQHKIQALMAKDSYPRFIESDLYQFILGNVSKA